MFKNQLCCTILLEFKKHHHHHNATNVITIYYNIVAIIERIALFEYALFSHYLLNHWISVANENKSSLKLYYIFYTSY